VNVFTKSLALELADKGIRVNAVLPGPFWTPAIATSDEETVRNFGTFTMLGRAGQPEEIAPAYVFLAADAPFMTGSLLVFDSKLCKGNQGLARRRVTRRM